MATDTYNQALNRLDVSGAVDPMPILSVQREMAALGNGETVYLISDCHGTGDDLRAWVARTHNALLQIDDLGDCRHGYLICKGEPWTPVTTVDTLGARCPLPVIELARAMATVEVGDVVCLLSDCTSAAVDLRSWATVTGQSLLGSRSHADGGHKYYIRKARSGHA